MKVFLTGGSGLLGSHLLDQLLKRGDHVTALVREIPQRSFLGQLILENSSLEDAQQKLKNLTLIKGDLSSFQAGGEFDVVIHAAAKTSALEAEKDLVWDVNLKGTQELHNTLKGRFQHWVQVSSIATMSDGSLEMVNEDQIGLARETAYAQSKLAGEKWIESQISKALIIHPCYMLGPWDAKPSSGAIFHAVRFGKINSYANVSKNFVAAADVAAGILKAVDQKADGHFILGNENIRLKEFFHLISQELQIPFAMTEKKVSDLSSDLEKEFNLTSGASIEKAQRKFSYQPQVNIVQMLKETMDYYEKFRMLKRAKISSL